jgi:hypothetical protein
LKELEELYNKENALATRGTDLDDVDSVVSFVHSHFKSILNTNLFRVNNAKKLWN